MAIFALSLELLVGATGLVSLGHAAFLGIAAYATLLLSPQVRCGQHFLSAARVDRLRRGLCFRRRRAVPAHARRLLHHGHAGLRADGLLRVPRHAARRRNRRHLPERQACGRGIRRQADRHRRAAGLLLRRRGSVWPACSCSWPCCCAVVSARTLAGIKSNEQRMRAAGFATFPYKLAAFTLAGALAGLAGFLVAVKDGYVNPEMLSWHESGRRAADADPRRHRPPWRCGARRIRLRAAAVVFPVGRGVRRFRQALAAAARQARSSRPSR